MYLLGVPFDDVRTQYVPNTRGLRMFFQTSVFIQILQPPLYSVRLLCQLATFWTLFWHIGSVFSFMYGGQLGKGIWLKCIKRHFLRHWKLLYQLRASVDWGVQLVLMTYVDCVVLDFEFLLSLRQRLVFHFPQHLLHWLFKIMSILFQRRTLIHLKCIQILTQRFGHFILLHVVELQGTLGNDFWSLEQRLSE